MHALLNWGRSSRQQRKERAFEEELRSAMERRASRLLLCWNRGLGDIPLGLYALILSLRQALPHCQITVLTRADLEEGFSLLEGLELLVAPGWRRGVAPDVAATLRELGREPEAFDWVIEAPDPTAWCRWQIGRLVPRLRWQREWEVDLARWGLQGGGYIGLHLHSETSYAYEKNWPRAAWEELFDRLLARGERLLLFGLRQEPPIHRAGIVDLRGETRLKELLSIVKGGCRALVGPDAGLISILYYLDVDFPLQLISLWADGRQGILKQGVPSPNRSLRHLPLLGEGGRIARIGVGQVADLL